MQFRTHERTIRRRTSMTRYLVEVPHENTKEACDRAIRLFQETGSHFLTHADWGCSDHVHKAWFVADVDTREEAVGILPRSFGAVRRSSPCKGSAGRILKKPGTSMEDRHRVEARRSFAWDRRPHSARKTGSETSANLFANWKGRYRRTRQPGPQSRQEGPALIQFAIAVRRTTSRDSSAVKR